MQQIFSAFRGGGLKAQLLRGGGSSIGLKISQSVLSLAIAVLLARTMGPEGYGIYSFIFALITLLAIPAQLGLPLLVVRETAAAEAKSDWGLMHGLWRWSTSVVIGFSIVLIFVAASIVWLFESSFTSEQLRTIALGLFFVPLAALANLRGAALRGLRKIVLGQLPEQIIRPGMFAVLILAAMFFYAKDMTPSQAMGLHVAAAGIAFITGAWLLRRANGDMHSSLRVYRSRRWFLSAIPVAAISGLQILNGQTDIIMIGIYMHAEDVGVYRVAVQGGVIALFLFQSLNIVIMPYIAKLYAENDFDQLRLVMGHGANMLLGATALVFIVVLIFGEVALRLVFGELFMAAAIPLYIICFGVMISSYFGFGGSLLVMTGRENKAVMAAFVAAVCNLVGNALLIPHFGINGAATATASSYVVWRALLSRYSLNCVGISANCTPALLFKR